MNENVLNSRKRQEKKHKLNDVIIIYTILSNCRIVADTEYFLKLKFTNLYNLKYNIPLHDTFSWAFRIISLKEFMNVFRNWVKRII